MNNVSGHDEADLSVFLVANQLESDLLQYDYVCILQTK